MTDTFYRPITQTEWLEACALLRQVVPSVVNPETEYGRAIAEELRWANYELASVPKDWRARVEKLLGIERTPAREAGDA